MAPPRLEDNQDVKIESQKHERQNFNDVSLAYKEILVTNYLERECKACRTQE